MNMSTADDGSAKIAPDDWERIARYLTGEADARETTATRRWIEADPERLATVNALERALLNVERGDVSDVDVESALRKVKTRFREPKVIPISPHAREGEPPRLFSPYLKAAAILLVLLGGPLLWKNVRGSFGPAGAQTFATTVGERRQFRLADGTGVVLGPTSQLVVNAGEDLRSVTLDGEAFFSVAHDASRPFTVKVGAVTVQDIGTAFAIQTDDSGGVRVVVDSGSVAVGAAETNVGSRAVLNARDRATLSPNGIVLVERSVASDDDLAWVQGRLVFRDAPLIQVGAELYRWYGVRLRVADSTLANLHLTASFSGEPVDRVLNVIALSLGARIERQGNVATLYRASTSGARR
jgi:transmembrane sensor